MRKTLQPLKLFRNLIFMDLSELSNEELREFLLERGITPGPIVATTRKVYEAKLGKLLAEEAGGKGGGESQVPLSKSRSRDSLENRSSAEESDQGEEESYEGEESFRKIDSPKSYEVPLSGNLYPRLPNQSLRPSEWFESKSGETSGVSRRAVTGPRTATPASVYSGNGGGGGGGVETGQGSGGKMIWIKLGLFFVSAIFVFMLLKRVTEGGEDDFKDDEKTH